MLNADQRRIFDQVSDHLNHQRRHETNGCECKDLKPYHMFVTGKSFLIETVRSLVKITPVMTVAAPTGLAAYNVGGVTVSSA